MITKKNTLQIDSYLTKVNSTEAAYIYNEYLTPFIKAIEPRMVFIPGDSGDHGAGYQFITYVVRQNTNYDLYMLHEDTIIYRVTTTNPDIMNKIVGTIISNTNIENIQSAIMVPGIRFMDAFAKSIGNVNDIFNETEEFWQVIMQINLKYLLT